jgi:hypothetical protein
MFDGGEVLIGGLQNHLIAILKKNQAKIGNVASKRIGSLATKAQQNEKMNQLYESAKGNYDTAKNKIDNLKDAIFKRKKN